MAGTSLGRERAVQPEFAEAEGAVERVVRQRADRRHHRERDRKIMSERVLADEPRTLQEIGDELGLTRERIRQLEKGIVDRLRDYLKEHVVDFEFYAPGDD